MASNRRYRTPLIVMEGGRSVGYECGPVAHHGFYGIERETVDKIKQWTRQYARLVSEWIGSVGLDPRLFGTHSLRRTKATLIYRRTGNLRAVQQPNGGQQWQISSLHIAPIR
jgi:integrase